VSQGSPTTGDALLRSINFTASARSDLQASRLDGARRARQHLLDNVHDVLQWHEEVAGCREYRERLQGLLRADGSGDKAALALFVDNGRWPPSTRRDRSAVTPPHLTRVAPEAGRVSDVTWTLRYNAAAYELLLRLMFEEPAPVARLGRPRR
jgi:hypothetical protein